MQDEIKNFFDIDESTEFEFREVCGFTFVFKINIIYFNKSVTSSEIKPVGIIYEENGEYYFAPLDKTDDINVIVEEYVKNKLLR